MERKKLAIVIPAYKDTFLRETLLSIKNQTNQDFTLYIGDDCSPFDLLTIVKEFVGSVDLVYKRFDENLGGSDLVAHWTRCVAMTQKEKYLWLFSDDDVMEKNCVEKFYETLEKTQQTYDIYHFDVDIIDENGDVVEKCNRYLDVETSYGFYKKTLQGKIKSLVVENVFSREIYEKQGGFQNFDLAWGSDTASWIKFMSRSGMLSIRDAYVRWRRSDKNITPNQSSPVVQRKTNAYNDYLLWSKNFFFAKENKNVLVLNIYAYIRRMHFYKKYLDKKKLFAANRRFCENHEISYLYGFINLLVRII